MENNSRRLVVVLGAGRSGTSLLMQILVGMGLQVSKNLVPANVSNSEGFFEDVEIKNVHADLISSLGSSSYIPLQDDWISSEQAKKTLPKLQDLLKVNIDSSSGIFGLKDPRINMLLPLWVQVFNKLSVVPRFILAVRSPEHVVCSMVRQYNDSPRVAELAWLMRTMEALEHTGLDCFIAHYEDLLSDQVPFFQSLLRFTGLDQAFMGNLSDVLSNIVKLNLNHSSKSDYKIQNPYVLKLYAALQECHGADFDRERLMAVVKECRQAMEGFKGWYQLAHQANHKVANMQARLEKASAEAAKVKSLEGRIQGLEKEKLEMMQLAPQLQKLQRQLDQLVSLN